MEVLPQAQVALGDLIAAHRADGLAPGEFRRSWVRSPWIALLDFFLSTVLSGPLTREVLAGAAITPFVLLKSALDVLLLKVAVGRHCGEVRQLVASHGAPVGPHDLLIAAQALALGLTAVTAKVDEFTRVPGLGVENGLSE